MDSGNNLLLYMFYIIISKISIIKPASINIGTDIEQEVKIILK